MTAKLTAEDFRIGVRTQPGIRKKPRERSSLLWTMMSCEQERISDADCSDWKRLFDLVGVWCDRFGSCR